MKMRPSIGKCFFLILSSFRFSREGGCKLPYALGQARGPQNNNLVGHTAMDKKKEKKEKDNERKKKILVVEDDPFLSDIYYTRLKETDFETDVAYTGDECWQKLKDKKYDLMVLDIVLPGMDGWEIMAKIREIRENGGPEGEYMENLKVIILSNLGLKEEIQKGLRLGADSFLLKAHFTPTQVVDEIQKIIK